MFMTVIEHELASMVYSERLNSVHVLTVLLNTGATSVIIKPSPCLKKRNNLHGYTSLVFLKKLRSSSSAFSDNANLPWCLSGINNADTPAYLSTLLEKDIVQQSFVCLRRVIILVCNYSKRCP